jgi:hypothetical protein
VLVNVGHQQQSVFLCLMRAGFGMSSVGGGVLVHIAELENRMWGVGAVVGAGQVYACGAGILAKTGGEVANGQISIFQALVGGSSYLGAGDMSIVGEQFARVSTTQDQNGLGMTWFNGAGSTSLIYVPSFVAAVVRAQKILGAEVRGRDAGGEGEEGRGCFALFGYLYPSIHPSIHPIYVLTFSLFPRHPFYSLDLPRCRLLHQRQQHALELSGGPRRASGV